MKKILGLVLIFLFTVVGCKSTSFSNTIDRNTNIINTNDNIDDKDEGVIKEFRSHHDYTNNELKNLEIKYLGTVDEYRIYYVPFKGSSGVLNPTSWTKEGYTFPIECQTRIIGIKSTNLYTIGNLIHETSINIKQLYEVLPEELKTK